jgi:hypothetical protein
MALNRRQNAPRSFFFVVRVEVRGFPANALVLIVVGRFAQKGVLQNRFLNKYIMASDTSQYSAVVHEARKKSAPICSGEARDD